jgi:ComEC/Rec2-related protein
VPAVSLLVSAVYVAFVGLEASAVRALLAAGCVWAAVVGERGSKFSQRWAVSLLCIQILMPWAVCDIGVQLTFAALGGIGIGSALGKGRTVITYLYVALCTWLFTGCVLAVWGGLLAPAGFLFNILLATPWSVLNCVVGSLGFLLLLLCGEWGCGVLDLVVVLNEVVAEWMVYCADGILGRAFQPEGRARVVTVALLALCSVALCVWAATRARLSIIRELVV